jgi:HlyD family secretion protein
MRLLPIGLALLLLAGCGAREREVPFQGYVEGDFVEVAPEVGGRIVELPVRRGDEVKAGALLFRLDDTEAKAAVAQDQAELARAEAQLANLQEGQRPPEIAVIEAQIAEAKASLNTAQKDLERQQELFDRRVASQARLDQAQEAVDVAKARVAAAEKQKEVAVMPARTGEIAAAERAVQASDAALAQAQLRLAKYIVDAPVAGSIQDVYYELGEVASIGAPVLELLPPDRRKVIFFIPEPVRTSLPVGSTVAVACDACPPGLTAKVTFLARESEFTPPVIYSRDTRDKLVFRAEASLSGEAARLPLGQPVDVTLVGGS